jgi:hypothetical protein
VLLFVDLLNENQCGSLELGAALAAGKRAFVVSENWWSIARHPNCFRFQSLESAVEAILEMQQKKEIA